MVPVEIKVKKPVMNVYIQNAWTAHDLSVLMDSIQRIKDVHYFVSKLPESPFLRAIQGETAEFYSGLISRVNQLTREFYNPVLGEGESIKSRDIVIKSIRYNSPGSISLLNLGRAIKEIRVFVKDIMYRNRQEKEMGELKLDRERSLNRLVHKYVEDSLIQINDSPLQIETKKVVAEKLLADSVRQISRLSAEMKLEDVTLDEDDE